jgi:hypothetical protein
VQVHELAVQGIMAALLLLSGNWFTGICHAALLAYMVQLYTTKRIYVDTTDAFRQLPQQKLQRGIMLGVHLVLFVVVVYRSAQAVANCHCLDMVAPGWYSAQQEQQFQNTAC